MKISRTTGYALQAAMYLAKSTPGTPVPCSQLAQNGGMPERFLLQILRSLVTHGVLQSTRGVDGGYCLKRSAEETSLLDVVEAVEGPLAFVVPEDHLTPELSERLKMRLGHACEMLRDALGEVKLSDVVRP